MQISAISRILGLLLMLLSITFVPPLFVEAWYEDGYALIYGISFAGTLGIGFLLWFCFRTYKHPLRTHDGFLIVVLFWLTASVVSALPLWLALDPNLSFTNAFFESVSGITTTGASVITQLDNLPHSFLYYRQQLQFLGGISIIILAVAIIPTLGIGGMQLFRTEASGPMKDDKLTPRITQTAKAIWLIYLFFILVCALCYYFAGMSGFDALCHSFSTVSTGGFSTHDASINFFHGPYIRLVAMVFMIIGAVSFNLHFLVFKRRKLALYLHDPEFRYFLKLLFTVALIIWSVLAFSSQHAQSPSLALDTLFQAVSFATTSGYTSLEVSWWPAFMPIMLLFLGMIGGCAGSTAGGIKVVRALLLQKQGTREIRRLIHPRGQYVIKLGNISLSPRIIEAIWGFIAVYFATFAFLLLLLLVFERDFLTAFSALSATISNTGRGLGAVTNNFANLSDHAKWVLSLAMIAGRLEIFTLLVLFSPAFWRR